MSDRYDQPLVSVDVVAFRRMGRDGLGVAVHERANDPYIGEVALPGVLLLPGESLSGAAARALLTKVGIPVADVPHLNQFGVFDGTNRDPRGATISIAYATAVPEGIADDTMWITLPRKTPLPFDHDAILSGALSWLHDTLWRGDLLATRALIGQTFTTSDALAFSESMEATPTDPSNFSRYLDRLGYIQRAQDQSGLTGRDTRWEWTPEGVQEITWLQGKN